jgi:L-seryl-tRNA(Ser) seleniumtransferase
LVERHPATPRWAATEAARRVVAEAREQVTPDGSLPEGDPIEGIDWVTRAAEVASLLSAPHPQRVINATGVVLHTNLGRAPMAKGAAEAAAAAAAGYSDLELDIRSGRRGNRLGRLEEKLRLLSGAEAGYACNNNAAAVLLVLNTLAAGRQVIVSRGELVEIGGSFRVPEIMRRAGVELVEVGSTNRTHPRDYIDAIGPDTAMLLKVHRSNFEVRGFVKEVELAELVAIGREHGVPVVEDLGSGTLIDLQDRGLPQESFAPGRIAQGPDLICFSGDKLMGGPQAGLVLGRAEHVRAVAKNPLARALRLDKMTLAALDWTLECMLDGRAVEELPLLRQLLMPLDVLEGRARSFAKRLEQAVGERETLELGIERDRVPIGGGSLPGFEVDGWVLAMRTRVSANSLAQRLRRAPTPVLARVRDGALLVDLRTVADDELATLESALLSALR